MRKTIFQRLTDTTTEVASSQTTVQRSHEDPSSFMRAAKTLLPLCVLFIPEFLALLYLVNTNYLPESDGSGYLIYGHRAYTHFRDGGLWEGLHTLYTIRDWRPIIFDAFLPPFLFITGGSIVWAYRLCILFITGYTTLYSFVLLKEKLSLFSACIGAALVVSLPSFLYLLVNFYPESATPGLVIGAIYHMVKSGDFSNIKHVIASAGLAVVALCVRPEQTLIMLAPVLIFAVGIAYRKKLVAERDVLLCALVPALVAAMFLLKILSVVAATSSFPTTGTAGAGFFLKIADVFLTAITAILALSIPIVFVLAWRTRSVAYSFVGFSLMAGTVPLLWFSPFALGLFEWMYQAALGDGAHNMNVTFLPLMANLWALLQASGSFLILSAAAILVSSLLARQEFVIFLAARGYQSRAVGYLIASVTGLFALVILGSGISPSFAASGQGWRRLLAPFCISILAFVMIGLRPGRRLALRQCLAMSLLLTQNVATGVKSSGSDWGIAHYRTFTAELEKPRWLVPEPNSEVISVLDRLAQTEKVSRVDIEGYTDISVGGVSLLASILPTKYTVGHDYIPMYSGPKDLPDLARRFSHIVFTMTPPMNGASDEIGRRIREYHLHPDANSQRQADILELLSSGALQHYGLQFVRTLVVGRSEAFFFRSLVYSENPPSGSATELGEASPFGPAIKDNFAAARNGARAVATSSQIGSPVSRLNDGTPAPWGAAETQDDTYAGVVSALPHAVQEFWITLFSPGGQQHLRDISVVVADFEAPNGPLWHTIRSRVAGDGEYAEKITVPPLADETVVHLEIDRTDPYWKPHRFWGFACLSGSRGYLRNYLKTGTGVYVRELGMK